MINISSRRVRIALGLSSLLAAGGVGYAIRARAAGIPAQNALSYGGVIEDASGPIDGPRNIQVLLWDAAKDGTKLCESAPGASFDVRRGHFAVPLPNECTTAVASKADVWASVLVDGSDTGRAKIGAVPFAVEARHAITADTATNATKAAEATRATNADSATSAAAVTGRLAKGMFRAVGGCTAVGQNGYDCICGPDEIAVGGGGICNTSGEGLSESANPPLGGGRDLSKWRVTCRNEFVAPANAYVLCVKAQ